MGLKFVQKLPDPSEIREQYPLPLELAAIKKNRDQEIKKVFTGESDKFLLIIGLSAPVLLTTRIPSAITPAVWQRYRKKLRKK